MKTELNEQDRERIEQETLEALWEKMSREDWLAGEGFSGKMGGLTKIPTVCKPRIFEFAKEYEHNYQREQQAELRNKVIEECVELLATNEYFRQNLFEVNLMKTLLNSLKTK